MNTFFIHKINEEQIYKWGYLLILLNAIGAFTSIALTSFTMIMGVFLLFILLIKDSEKNVFSYSQKQLLKLLSIFLGCLLCSIPFSNNVMSSLNEYIHFVSSFISLLIGMVFVREKRQFFKWILVVSISVFLSDISAIIQLVNGEQTVGFVHNRINFANQCVSAIFILFVFLMNVEIKYSKIHKIWLALVLLLTLIILAYSQVRGAWVAFLGTLVAYICINKNINKKFFLVLGFLFVIFMFLIFNNDILLQRFQSIINFQTDNNIKDRLDMYQSAVKMFLNYPIYGVGFGNFRDFYMPDSIYLIDGAAVERFPEGYPHAHNTVLTFLAETGILGTGGLIIFFGKILINFAKKYLNNYSCYISLIGFSVLMGFILSSLTDNVYGESMFIRFAMISIGICLSEIRD